MKIGFLISVYNKIDDLAAHLEIFKYCPFDHEVIVVYMMDLPPAYQEQVNQFHNVRIDGLGHYVGPLLSAVAGVRKAHELGLDYVVYRNADDWLFNYKWEKKNFDLMAEKKYLCAGYNWMNVGVNYDITLNQVYFDVPAFEKTADDAERYFRRSERGFLCEFKMARWVKRTCTDLQKDFYRLPGREQFPGIGWEEKDIAKAFRAQKMDIPPYFWDKFYVNNRYFNEKWQLIGSHDNQERLRYWKRLRRQIPYAFDLENEPNFARFLKAAKNKEKWNVEPPMETLSKAPAATDKKPKIYKRKIF